MYHHQPIVNVYTAKYFILKLLFVFLGFQSHAQKLEFSGGVNRNNYFDGNKDQHHFESEYHPGYGYSFGIGISEIKKGSSPPRFALRLDRSTGKIYTHKGSLASGYTTEAEVAKTTLGLGFYPFNFKVLKRIQFSIGMDLSFRISDKTSGYKKWWEGSQIVRGGYMTIDNDSMSINNNVFFGISGRVGYLFNINEKWGLLPYYRFYMGVTDEFKNTEAEIKSMRHSFEIGIVRNLE